MMIIGVDYHPSFQTIAFLMEETGECGEQELNHSDGQAELALPKSKAVPTRILASNGAACCARENLNFPNCSSIRAWLSSANRDPGSPSLLEPPLSNFCPILIECPSSAS